MKFFKGDSYIPKQTICMKEFKLTMLPQISNLIFMSINHGAKTYSVDGLK